MMSPVRIAFLKGFAVGAGLVVVPNVGEFMLGRPISGWVDLAVQALLLGILIGAGTGVYAARKKTPPR